MGTSGNWEWNYGAYGPPEPTGGKLRARMSTPAEAMTAAGRSWPPWSTRCSAAAARWWAATYQAVPALLDEHLAAHGARRVYDRGEGNAASDDGGSSTASRCASRPLIVCGGVSTFAGVDADAFTCQAVDERVPLLVVVNQAVPGRSRLVTLTGARSSLGRAKLQRVF